MKQSPLNSIKQKLLKYDLVAQQLKKWQGQKIVFTNGCFDILHYGHLHVLSEAASLGDKLIVGVNSDASVKRLKGNERPIQKEDSRALLLGALEMVDAVVIFEEDTPYNIIKEIQPDIIVKGGDYAPNKVVGADIVKAKGGKVVIVGYISGYSTTGIEEKMKNS